MKNEWSKIAENVSGIQVTKNRVLNPILYELLNKHATGKDLFEYGCGWGEFANETHESGFNVTAFDEANEMVNYANKHFPGPIFMCKSEFEADLEKLKGQFDVVTSNLVLCILEKEQQDILLARVAFLLKKDGIAIISFCHPKYDYLKDSLVSKRFTPPEAQYKNEFVYEKEIKENGIRFKDIHRPLEYYLNLFERHDLEVIEQRESDVLGTEYMPDFIIFTLRQI